MSDGDEPVRLPNTLYHDFLSNQSGYPACSNNCRHPERDTSQNKSSFKNESDLSSHEPNHITNLPPFNSANNVSQSMSASNSLIIHDLQSNQPSNDQSTLQLNGIKKINSSDDIQNDSLASSFSQSIQLVDNDQLIANIIKILQASVPSKSIIDEAIPKEYQAMFGSNIPPNWLISVRNSNQIIIEEDKFTNKTIRRICLPTSPLKSHPNDPLSASTSDTLSGSGLSIATQILPGSVVLTQTANEGESVIVTQVINTDNVILRLYQFNNEFIHMVEAMFAFYHQNKNLVQTAKVGKIYAVVFEETARRVEAIQEISKDEIECRDVDGGEVTSISIKNLHEIDNQFLKLPFQAISVKLSNLEAYANNAIAIKHLRKLIAQIEHSLLIAVVAKNGVTLYDTSKPNDVNINLEVINYLQRHAYDYITQAPGSTFNGTVVECTPYGEVYIQFESNFRQKLLSQQYQISQQCAFQVASLSSSYFHYLKPKIVSAKGTDMIFYAPYGNDWFRVIIIDLISEETVRVYFVDYGNELNVDVSQIYQFPLDQDPLKGVPFLGIKCFLEKVPEDDSLEWTPEAARKLFTLFSNNEYLKVKVIKSAQKDKSCSVELIDEIQGSFIFLNQKLSSFKTCFKAKKINKDKSQLNLAVSTPKNVSKVANTSVIPNSAFTELDKPTVPEELTVPSKPSENVEPKINNEVNLFNSDLQHIGGTAAIPPPKLPTYNPGGHNLIRIEVTHAINPHNFYVKLVDNKDIWVQFEKMEKDMQELYENEEDRLELELQVMQEKRFYAIKFENKWHRARLDKLLNPMPPMFYLVDVGGIHPIEVRNIQPLYTQFRSKPMAAIKASLSNLKPVAHDWDPIACYQFCEQVRQKSMFAIVNSMVELEEEMVLNLSLNQPGNNVEEVLTQQKFAIKLDS